VQSRNETVDIGDVVGSALQRATAVLAQHSVQLNIDAGLPMAQGDPVLLEQALFNLLDNAAKYTPARTTITLTARRDDGRIALQIADEGAGLPNDARERVFDKFYRVHAGDSQRAGTGLGLAICRGFVEAMGGTITAGNRTDRAGAVFTIMLPAARQVES
jgi:two-component system sensor histidine kinase KdpD